MTGPVVPPDGVLGRYSPDPLSDPLIEVRLLRLPLRLLRAGQEHHDGVMREFRLMALAGEIGPTDAPSRLADLVTILGRQYASSRERRDEEVDAALERGLDTIDQVAHVPGTVVPAVLSLRDLMAEADQFCEDALLVSLPRPPLLRRFGDWYLSQFVDQVAGRAATPWEGPLDLDPVQPWH